MKQIHGKDDPVLVLFEYAFAISEAAGRRGETPRSVAVDEPDTLHSLIDRMSVIARIPIDACSHLSGNPGHGFKPAQPVLDRIIDHHLQFRSGVGPHRSANARNYASREAEHE